MPFLKAAAFHSPSRQTRWVMKCSCCALWTIRTGSRSRASRVVTPEGVQGNRSKAGVQFTQDETGRGARHNEEDYGRRSGDAADAHVDSVGS